MSDINVDPTVKAPDMFGPVSTVRLYCRHGNSEAQPADGFDGMNIATAITLSAMILLEDDGRHKQGLVFNEDTDTPFAVVFRGHGDAAVCWNFKGDNNFDTAELEFETGLGATEFLAYTINLAADL